jgi:diguanylate cyclase (GGDEF)-like protein
LALAGHNRAVRQATGLIGFRSGFARLSGTSRIWGLNVIQVILAVVLFVTVGLPNAHLVQGFQIPWYVLACMFLAAEVWVVHFHFRRDAHSFSLSEIPLVLGLFFTSPAGLILAQLLGGGLALALHRRQSPLKLVFNLSKHTTEVGLAILVFRAMVGLSDPLGPRAWLATFTATAILAVYGVLMITLAMSFSEGRLQTSNVRQVLAFALFGTIVNSSLGLVTVTLFLLRPTAVWLLLIPALMLFIAYRAYTSERQKNESIESLYESSRLLQRSTEVEPAMLALLSHVRKVFRSEIAEATFFPTAERDVALRTRVGPGGEVVVMTPVELMAAEREISRVGQGSLLLSKSVAKNDAEAAAFLSSRLFKDAMVIALQGESRQIGTILVADRLGDSSTFDAQDLKLFETIAGQASVSLENGRLEHSLAQLRQLEEQLKHQAFHDSLTGLANRALFSDRVVHALQRRTTGGHRLAVLFLDLDDFKTVNDSLGHIAGDQLLMDVADRVRGILRPEDTAARIGGDEFAILLEEVSGTKQAVQIAQRVVDALSSPFKLQGDEVRVHASIGIVIGMAGDAEAGQLMQNADVAMYHAKRGGKGRYMVFEPGMRTAVESRHVLKEDLQRAVERSEFSLHYQPIVAIATGRMVAVEALIRWRHPTRGNVPPDQFIPLAEETGLIVPIGEWVLREACEQARRWQLGFPSFSDLGLSVNLSFRQLRATEFLGYMARILHETGFEPNNLVLEITETAMMEDTRAAIDHLRRLKELGVRLAIDDFGTGYSSLSWLRSLPIDILKIAKPFIDGIGGDTPDQNAFAHAIARLGGSLNMQMVAEGIEHEAQVRTLGDMQLELGQGFYFSVPLTPAEMADVLAGDGILIPETAIPQTV